MEGKPAQPTRWWGRFDFGEGVARRWAIGPSRLLVERRRFEWRISQWHAGDGDRVEGGLEVKPHEISGATVLRFASRSKSSELELVPAVADRTVVARPEDALEVPPEETSYLFVGGPLWLQIREGFAGRLMADLPVVRPPDTWFGPTTITGELAYASRTAARLAFENAAPRPYRILTRIGLENRSPTNLRIERIALPAPNLSVFADSSGRLWTEDVDVVIAENTALADVTILKSQPREAGPITLVSDPRRDEDPSFLVRALSAFGI